MARRIVALVGFVAVLALALTLLYRVYIHHTRTEPYDDGAPAVVELDGTQADAKNLRTLSAKSLFSRC